MTSPKTFRKWFLKEVIIAAIAGIIGLAAGLIFFGFPGGCWGLALGWVVLFMRLMPTPFGA